MAITVQITTPLPLMEAVKALPETSAERIFVENMVENSDVLRAILFKGVTFGKAAYLDIAQLPSVGFRGINEAGNESIGSYNLREEDTFFVDEYVKTDRAIIDRYKSNEPRVKQERLKTIALAQMFSQQLIKGDNSSNPRSPTGLQARCNAINVNYFNNSAASGGAALSLVNMDKLYWSVNKPTHWIMPRSLMPFWDAAARNNSLVNQTIGYAEDDFGRKIIKYKGLPILFGYEPDDTPDLLPLTEVAAGGGGAVTGSIYCVSLRDGGLYAIEQTPLTVDDEGLIKGQPFYSTHIKWDWGIAREHPKACARLDSIASGAIVA